MSDSPVLIQATVFDAYEVSRLLRSAMLTYCTDSGIPESMLEALSESVESVADRISKQICLIAKMDGKIIGTVCLKTGVNPLAYNFSDKTYEFLKDLGDSGYISRFAVDENYRKTGIGVDLITRASEIARDSGSEYVLLHSASRNRKIVDFYLKRGFVLIDSENSRGYSRGLFARQLDRL